MRFTEITPQRVQRLQPGESLSEHGILVAKLPDGDEKWSLAFMFHRDRVKRVLGRKSEGWIRTRAEDEMSAIKANILSGQNRLPKGRKTELRFGELARWYLDEMEATGGKNLAQKRLQVEQRLIPAMGRLPVASITDEHLGRYAKTQLDAGLSPSTINRDFATVSHIWTTAEKRRKLRHRPCVVSRLKEPEGRTEILSDGDAAKLLHAARQDSNPSLYLFVEFGLQTAMRSAEIVQARFDRIDWDMRRLFIPFAKGGSRVQPLTRSLTELLAEERSRRDDDERDGWVFPSPTAATGHVPSFSGAFQRAVIAAGLSPDRITPHVMRHTAATNLVASGAPLPAVQKVTGHKTLVMLKRYTHLTDRHVDQALAALERGPADGEDNASGSIAA